MGLPEPAQARNPCFPHKLYIMENILKHFIFSTQALYYGDEDMPFTEKFGTKYQKL